MERETTEADLTAILADRAGATTTSVRAEATTATALTTTADRGATITGATAMLTALTTETIVAETETIVAVRVIALRLLLVDRTTIPAVVRSQHRVAQT